MIHLAHQLTFRDWVTITVLAVMLIAGLASIYLIYPRVARALDVAGRVDHLANLILHPKLFEKTPWARRILRRLFVNSTANLATQIIQTAILLPVAFVALSAIWLFDHLPLFWAWIIEHAPWVEGAVPLLVIIAGLLIIAIGFWLRENHARTYGIIEIGVAVAALFLVGRSPSISEGLLPFASAVYVGVRGCDNVRRGFKLAADKKAAK